MSVFRGLQTWLIPYADYLVRVAEYNGLRVQITSVFRSNEKQQILYQRYLRCRVNSRTCIPAAPPGRSQHNYGRAFDLVVNGDYRGSSQEALGRFWQSMGGVWGGSRDPVHFGVP